MSLLGALNPPQREAAKYLDGPLLVLAGAGSRQDAGHHPQDRLPDRRVRLSRRAPSPPSPSPTRPRAKCRSAPASCCRAGNAKGLIVTTFHSLGLRMLREDAKFAGSSRAFSILDAADAQGIIAEILQDHGQAGHPPCGSRASRCWKNELLSPAAALQDRRERHRARLRQDLRALRGHPARLSGGRFRRPDPPAGRIVGIPTPNCARNGRTACATCWWTNTRTPTPPVPAAQNCSPGRAPRSPRSATTIRPSTAGAAPRPTTCSR